LASSVTNGLAADDERRGWRWLPAVGRDADRHSDDRQWLEPDAGTPVADQHGDRQHPPDRLGGGRPTTLVDR
jgi:hypothetical protein